ncbi:MAG: hypothetical protein Q9218_005488 [Villophora microphyllina]
MGNKASSIFEQDMPYSSAGPDILEGIFTAMQPQPDMADPCTNVDVEVNKVHRKPTEKPASQSLGPAGASDKKECLELLDLPLDILKDIVKEVTHTNDLTSLALTCSALHGLAIPWIYSRFDIVWPDTHSSSDSRQGVDALTHGLATLVMGEIPNPSPQPANSTQNFTCTHCGTLNAVDTAPSLPIKTHRQRRRGNHYPQYTRKFSLGNGPDEWIKEYLINRESGKMLGTLVALSISRMPNLQTFVWDMPTGVLRDCWLALSSLGGEENTSRSSSLETIWIRFHDNKEIIANPDFNQYPAPKHLGNHSSFYGNRLVWSYRNTEYPSFSVLPPLRSVNVLNIDEIAYFQEMSVLLERSMDCLRKLRIGIACAVPQEGFASESIVTNDGVDGFPNDKDPLTTYKGALDLLLRNIYGANVHKSPPSIEVPAHENPSLNDNTKYSQSESAKPMFHSVATNWLSRFRTSASSPASESCVLMNMDSASDPAGILSGLVIGQSSTAPPSTSEIASTQVSTATPPTALMSSSTSTPAPTGQTEKGKRDWPPQLRNYVQRSFTEENILLGISHAEMESRLKEIITHSVQAGTLTTVDWDNLQLPQSMIQTDRDQRNVFSVLPLQGNSFASLQSHDMSTVSPVNPLTTDPSTLDGFSRPDNSGGKQPAESATTISSSIPIPCGHQHRQLKLEVLELERVYISVPSLLKAIDWSVVTTLTILHCDNHEQLWKAFRRSFTPRMISATSPDVSKPLSQRRSKFPSFSQARSSADPSSVPASEYRLNLRRLHTDTVSPALIHFLKETLAPNSLEWLFLQDGGIIASEQSGERESYASTVTIDQIFKGPLRRHRSSLKKLMVDSNGLSPSRWRKWILNRDVLSYIVSGKMSALREIAFSLDHKDWHFFLQRLPQIPHVRSLYIPHIAEHNVGHMHGHHFDPKEIALQIMDVVALRPDVELCYLGIANKCFEIMEGTFSSDDAGGVIFRDGAAVSANPESSESDDDDSDHEDEDDEDEDDEGEGMDHATASTAAIANGGSSSDGDVEEAMSETDGDSDILMGEDGQKHPRLKLREILFYDDKVSVFKARHRQL